MHFIKYKIVESGFEWTTINSNFHVYKTEFS